MKRPIVNSDNKIGDGAAPSPPPGEPLFLNRDLGWLEFNRRVLSLALDGRTPLLERVRFLSIFSSNLDEFFQKRVGGLKRQVAAGVAPRRRDDFSPTRLLAMVRQTVLPLLAQQAHCFEEEIRPALAANGIDLLAWDGLAAVEREAAARYFKANVYPVLTPLAVDPGHPFPFISNLSTSLGVILRHPAHGQELFARVKVPSMLPAWIRLETSAHPDRHRFVSLTDLISHNLADLFPGMQIVDTMPFRVTRNADIERDEEDADDLLELIEEEVQQRRMAGAVRLEHGRAPNPRMLEFLCEELELAGSDVYAQPALLDFTGLQVPAGLNRPDLKYERWSPVVPPELAGGESDIFAVMRRGDLLIHHPYESFEASVERFIHAAAADPQVLAIKMTVYRTGDESPFVRTLIRAAEAGKQVICLLELKARFDEERNIQLAQALEEAGVHVVYGIVGLKTHTKCALVVRREAEGLCCYAHVGTGNYHTQTAKLYTDLGLLTCDADLTAELVELFNYLTGRSLRAEYSRLLVAPINMKDRFLALIARETGHAAAGRPSGIVAKMNSLEDRDIVLALYEASRDGVPVDLIVRGFCCLRPGVPGLSENVRVVSVLGRFLEHSRIFHFRNGAADPLDGDWYLGSADWMERNLQARVEAVTPVLDRALRERCRQIMDVMRADRRQAWDMRPDGSYVLRRPGPEDTGPAALGTHQALMDLARGRARSGAAAAEAAAAPADGPRT